MKQTLKVIALAGLTQLIAWSQLGAQADLLPEGFPKDDLVYNGDNNFTSVKFGSFKLDTNTKNRVVHTLLGPLVWDYDNKNKIVILKTERWGDLHSTLPTESSALGFTWPYFYSALTNSIYIIDVSGSTDKPFFNHTRSQDPNFKPPFWGKSIGIPLDNAESYFLHAESTIVRMQQTIELIRTLRNQLGAMTVAIGSNNIEQQRLLAIQEFTKMHQHYGTFQFYRHRTKLAHKFIDEKEENFEGKTKRALWFGNHVDTLTVIADGLMSDAQKALFEEIDGPNGAFNRKLNERTALIVTEQQRQAAAAAAAAAEQQRQAAEAAAAAAAQQQQQQQQQQPPPQQQPTPPPTGGGSGGVDPNPNFASGQDAISASLIDIPAVGTIRGNAAYWPITATLHSIKFTGFAGYKYDGTPYGFYSADDGGTTRAWPFARLDFWSREPDGGYITGVAWIVFPKNDGSGRFWATPFEWHQASRGTEPYFDANLYNWVRDNFGVPFWPQSGATYGFFISHASAFYYGSNIGASSDQRTNIILSTFIH